MVVFLTTYCIEVAFAFEKSEFGTVNVVKDIQVCNINNEQYRRPTNCGIIIWIRKSVERLNFLPFSRFKNNLTIKKFCPIHNFVTWRTGLRCRRLEPYNDSWSSPIILQDILDIRCQAFDFVRSECWDIHKDIWPFQFGKSSFGFIQLALHDIQLTPKNTCGNRAYYDQGAGKPANMACPPRHHSFIDLMWSFVFIAMAAYSVYLSFKGTEYADDHSLTRAWWWVPFLVFLALAFWFANHALNSLASFDRRSENIRVLSIIVAELEFGDIERHIFPAHFVKRADDTSLEDRPEAFDGLRMNCADDILPLGMIDDAARIFLTEFVISGPLICKAG
jgi:hypothetical protein